MFYNFRTEKNADFQTIKNKKFYANKKISEKPVLEHYGKGTKIH
jgi:hypothetical protein